MGTHPIFESDFDCLTEMKIIASLLAAFALAAPGPSDPAPEPAPEPAPADSGMQQSIVMINMNAANIQMNMGDFRGNSDVNGEGIDSDSWKWSFLDGIKESDKKQIEDLLALDDVQNGLKTLSDNLPGFKSFVDAMTADSSDEL